MAEICPESIRNLPEAGILLIKDKGAFQLNEGMVIRIQSWGR